MASTKRRARGLRWWRPIASATLALTTPLLTRCKTAEPDSAQTKSIQLAAEGTAAAAPFVAPAGVTVYFAEGNRIFRFGCDAAAMAAMKEREALDDPRVLRAKCRERRGAIASGYPVGDFRSAVKAAYLKKVDDSNLTSQEEKVLSYLLEMMAATGAERHPQRASPQEQAAIDAVQARFAGVFDLVFDAVTILPRTATQAAVATPGLGLGLNGGGGVAIGSLGLRTNFAPALPFQVDVAGSSTGLVDTIRVGLALDPSGDCRARVVGVSAVTALTPTGPASVTVSMHPIKADAWQINNGAPIRVLGVRVTVRRPRLSDVQTCILTVNGETDSGALPRASAPVGDRDARMQSLTTDRAYRMWYFLWHGIRNAWPSMTAANRREIRAVLGSDWGRSDAETEETPQPDQGEEFLHMHRQMLGMLRAALGDKMYERWKDPPVETDAAFPLPNGRSERTAQELVRLMDWNGLAKDPSRLQTMSLGAYGRWLETNLHDTMHMRWADRRKAVPQLSEGGLFLRPEPAWDFPANDYLGSTYSAHVNPIFWRLHGYIDDRIADWLKANGYTSIAEDCTDAKCYRWKRTWTGPFPGMSGHAIAAGMALASATPFTARPAEAGPDQFQKLSKTLARMITENSTLMPSPADE